MLISLIVAMAQNRCIGRDGTLPWQLPADLQRFKQITMGHTLLMGRKTYQSIGRPLPGRTSIVLSQDPSFTAIGCIVAPSLDAALTKVQTEQLFICGGADIYRQTLPLADKIYLTELLVDVTGDAFFPELPQGQFRIIQREELIDARQKCRFSILQKNV